MASIGDTTRPEYIYDQATDTWIPVGIGPHSHTPAAIGAISSSLVTAKGDLIVGTGSGVVVAQPVGTNGQVLTADSTQADGVVWSTPTGMSNPMTTTGDIIYSSSGSTPARRAIGTTGQVLTVSGGVPTWATASSGGITLISTTTMTGSSQVNLTSIPQTYQALKLIVVSPQPASSDAQLQFLLNNNSNNPTYSSTTGGSAFSDSSGINSPYINSFTCVANSNSVPNVIEFNLPYYTNSSYRKYGYVTGVTRVVQSPNNYGYGIKPFFADITSAITQINMFFGGQNFAGGTAFLYGVN